MNQDFDERQILEPLWMVPLETAIMMKQAHEKLNENLDGLWN